MKCDLIAGQVTGQVSGQVTPQGCGQLESRPRSPEIVDTARRDSAFQLTEGKPQSLPVGQDKLHAIEAEARETDKALKEILEKLGV